MSTKKSKMGSSGAMSKSTPQAKNNPKRSSAEHPQQATPDNTKSGKKKTDDKSKKTRTTGHKEKPLTEDGAASAVVGKGYDLKPKTCSGGSSPQTTEPRELPERKSSQGSGRRSRNSKGSLASDKSIEHPPSLRKSGTSKHSSAQNQENEALEAKREGPSEISPEKHIESRQRTDSSKSNPTNYADSPIRDGKDTENRPFKIPRPQLHHNPKGGASEAFSMVVDKCIYEHMQSVKDKDLKHIESKVNIKCNPLEDNTIKLTFEAVNDEQQREKAVQQFQTMYREYENKIHSIPTGFIVHEMLQVYIHESNITALSVDGIVNAANGGLHHHGGVAKAIADRAGSELTRQSSQALKENEKDFEVSDVVPTTSGRLPCGVVLHAVGPRWPDKYRVKAGDRKEKEEQCITLIHDTFLHALCFGDMLGLTSLAIPPISSGIYGVPHEHVCQQLVSALMSFGHQKRTNLQEIHIIDINDQILSAVAAKLRLSENVSVVPLGKVIECLEKISIKIGAKDNSNPKEGSDKKRNRNPKLKSYHHVLEESSVEKQPLWNEE